MSPLDDPQLQLAQDRYPFGLTSGLTDAQLVAKLGKPSLGRTLKLKRWHVLLSRYEPEDGKIFIRIESDDEKSRRP